MVFESIVADVLNRFLGDYIENLDYKQLKLGIWGGDIVLTNLQLKQKALKDLDLPIQTVFGRLDKLVAKIPWKNLYGAAVEVTIEGLYLLVNPNNQVEYDAVKEEEREFQNKKSELQKIEDLKKLQEVTPVAADDTFVEKLVTQIIKNVQLSIKNIHVRYEDNSLGTPFAMGCTLSNLILKTTTSDWKPMVVTDMVKQIFKIVTLEGAAVYWNCDAEMFSDAPEEDRRDLFIRDIANKTSKPANYKYILGPINSEARLVLNPKPEQMEPAFSLPKAHAELQIDLLAVGISMCQYRDIVAFADSMRMQTLGLPYRKYRPNVPIHGHTKKWWFFAYTCIMETDVKRRKRNWDWQHMCDHRDTCKRYGELYKSKLSNKKVPTEVEDGLNECERKLDLYNLVLIRRRIAMEVEMLEQRRKEQEPKGWFSGWFGSSKTVDDDQDTKDYLKRFQQAMTPEEKKKLFAAIDYSENSLPTLYPDNYVDTIVKFELKHFKFNIRNDVANIKSVVKLNLMEVQTSIEHRPKNNGLMVSGYVGNLSVTGVEQNDILPQIISSKQDALTKQKSLLDLVFDMNPLDLKNGNRIRLSANPLQIVYDAHTINEVINFFKIPSSESLDELTHATADQISSMKEKSALGLQSAIENHKKLDVHIKFSAPIIIIPHDGLNTGGENVIVINLGTLMIKSVLPNDTKAVHHFIKSGYERSEVMNQMILQSYDRFRIELTDIQVLVAQSDESWVNQIMEGIISPMHILYPINLSILLETCMIHNDPKLPLTKVSVQMPSITVNITDARLMLVLNLVQSILKKMQSAPPGELVHASSSLSVKLSDKLVHTPDIFKDTEKSVIPLGSSSNQMTILALKFELQNFLVQFMHQESISDPEVNVFNFSLRSLTCGFNEKTFTRSVTAGLGSIKFTQYYKAQPIEIISTLVDGSPKGLFTFEFMQVNKKCPDFESVYNNTLTSVVVDFAVLEITLHNAALVELIKYQTEIQAIFEEPVRLSQPTSSTSQRRASTNSSVVQLAIDTARHHRKKKKNTNDILCKFTCNLERIAIEIIYEEPASKISIGGLYADVIVKDEYVRILSHLRDITVIDMNPKSLYGVIMSVDQMQKAIAVDVTIHNDAPIDAPDIVVNATLGRLRVSLVFWYLANMLNFLNTFQDARETIIAASQKAAQTAKEQMESMYAKATKIKVDVNVKAPEIMIPEKSTSLNGVLLDLGHITISNQFHVLDIRNEKGHNAIIDQMELKLEDLTIDSIVLNKDIAIIERVPILQPLSFILKVNRNLSQWHSAIPDLDINGILDHIIVHLGQNDYSTIMNILNGNMTEGRFDEPPAPPAHPVEAVSFGNTSIDTIKLLSNAEIQVKSESALDVEHGLKTTVRWNFALHSFKVNLYNTTSPTVVHPTRIRNNLGQLSFEGFLAKGRITSDKALSNSLLLMNVVLTDTRANREGKIIQFLHRTQLQDDRNVQNRNMVDMTFQTRDNDTFVDLRVYSFNFLLSVEYLLKLSGFFQAATLNDAKVTSKKAAVTLEKKVREKPKETNAMFSLSIKLEKPDIILVENIDDLNTRALILNCEFLTKLRFIGPKQTINGTLSDLQMYTCMFNPVLRESTKNMLLDPLTLSIAGSTPEDHGLHAEVYLTSVYISVSFCTIELINNILMTVAQTSVNAEAQAENLVDMSNLWDVRPNLEKQFWFLETEKAEEALVYDYQSSMRSTKTTIMDEMCIVSVPDIVITLQAGVGHKTFPIIALESRFNGKIANWSSQMNVDATLALEMGYYNNLLALWEPVIEPVSQGTDASNTKYIPWEINLEVNMTNLNETDESKDSSADIDYSLTTNQPMPTMTVEISSPNNLELTVTKTGLDVIKSLGTLFGAVASESAAPTHHDDGATGLYKVVNTTGTDIIIDLAGSELILKDSIDTKEIILQDNSEIYLDPIKVPGLGAKKFCSYTTELKEQYLNVELSKLNTKLRIPYLRAVNRYFRIPDPNNQKGFWALVSSISVIHGITIITFCSIIEVHNYFNIPLDIYYMRESGNELECIATIQPHTSMHLPLHSVYSATSELFFSIDGFSITSSPFVWKDLQLDVIVNKNLICTSKTDAKSLFIIKVVGEMKQIYYQNTTKFTMSSTMYRINLRPAVRFKNCIPYDITLSVDQPQGILLKPGDTIELPNVDPGVSELVITLPNYLDKDWSCSREFPVVPSQFSVWTFDNHHSIIKMSLDLGVHCLNLDGSFVMTLYCPFLMINKTGLDLSYRKSKKTEKNDNSGSPFKATDENSNVLYHPSYMTEPILFSFNARNFFGKKKACVKVRQGEWCDKFSIDVAGSSGVITCQESGRLFQLGVNNTLTSNGLTKLITFAPYFIIINQSGYAIECQEDKRPADSWVLVEPKSCAPFWPVSQMEDKLICMRMQESPQEVSIPFLITESHTTLVKLKNKFGGVNVDIQLTEGAVYINLALYDVGMAPALLINHTKHTLNIWEKKSVHIHKLPVDSNMYFTWDYPSSDRVLVWEGGYREEYENELRSDGIGQYSITNNLDVYWVSFLDGMQRVLLFTCDGDVAENALTSKKMDVIDREVTLALNGVGISFVNNLKRQEILYMGITSTGIIWETCKAGGKRYKQVNPKNNMDLENSYQQYMASLTERKENASNSTYSIGNIEVDYQAMRLIRPHARIVRRRFETGIWIQMKTSPHQMQLHAKINRLQMDNQLHDCTFPVLLAPVPPPKSVAETNANKPFAELSIVQLLIKNSQIQQYKYFKFLIQEFDIKIDLGFINSIMEIFDTSEKTEEEEKQIFHADLQSIVEPLYSHVTLTSMAEQKSFYDLLHLSPIKVHVSFSMASGGTGMGNMPVFLGVLLQGIGVTLTDMQDVVFKLSYFEREYCFLSKRQLVSETGKHYVGQTVKQLYVLVLGLDVIGNPYGLVLGITKGVGDLFYEPFQGAIQGPGEFAEGLAFGVASLFGHTFGGAAGAVSRITGAMGKGIAALSFDKEYQRKRRDQINKRPATVTEGIARSGKGLVMGVVDGVTGVFTKPITGAKEQGVGGFFKGLGKGAVGLVTRPTAGVMDFASSSLDSVKRVTEFSTAFINRLRPARFVQRDRLVRPYNQALAFGNKILCELDKGKFYSTDIYCSHYIIVEKKEVLLLSDKRIAYVTHNDIFGGWQVDWMYTWQELEREPELHARGVQLFVESRKKHRFKSNETNKIILLTNEAVCRKIIEDVTYHITMNARNVLMPSSNIEI